MYAIVGEPHFLYIGHGNVLKTQFWRRSVPVQCEAPTQARAVEVEY